MVFIIPYLLVFAYSRIYLGLHYPIDILSGFIWDISGYLVFKIYKTVQKSIPLLVFSSIPAVIYNLTVLKYFSTIKEPHGRSFV
jgi:membrane-associated phospholipid phosphatase